MNDRCLKDLIRFENPILDWPHRNCIRVFFLSLADGLWGKWLLTEGVSWGKGWCFEYELFHLGILALTGTPLSTVINIMNWIWFDKTHTGVVTRHLIAKHPCYSTISRNLLLYSATVLFCCVVSSPVHKITFEWWVAIYLNYIKVKLNHFPCTSEIKYLNVPYTLTCIMQRSFSQSTQLIYGN